MKVTLHYVECLQHDDMGLLNDCLTRVKQHQHVLEVDLYLNERGKPDSGSPGWCEYLMRIQYEGGGSLTIGCIQRELGARTEFHS